MASEDVERPACSPGYFGRVDSSAYEAVVVRYIWTTLWLNISAFSLILFALKHHGCRQHQ
jgi:hypothetical protein